MNTEARYNEMIDMIEDRISEWRGKKTIDIAESIAKKQGMGYRDLNAIFTYLTGFSLTKYITRRRLISAIEFLFDEAGEDMDNAILLSGYEDENSFSKIVSELFSNISIQFLPVVVLFIHYGSYISCCIKNITNP